MVKDKMKFQRFAVILLLLISFFCFNKNVNAQTNPTAQNLTYTQNFGTTTFTSCPAGIGSWTVSSSPKGTQSSAESSAANGDASITAATSAQTTGGCYGYATSSNGRFYIQTSSNATNGTNQLAAAVVTTGLQNIKVSYDVEMISSQPKTIGVVLQYRIGTSGSWTTVTGGVYSHNSSDRSAGQIDSYTNLSLPSTADNNSIVQLRWATWRGSETGNSSGIAIDNISITGTSIANYFRSKQTGNWNNSSSWEMSSDNSNWSNATSSPNYHSNTITIQSGHTITITASDTIDQVVVNGTLIYGDFSGSTLTLYNGTGVDIAINGTFEDSGPNNLNWLSSSTWEIGSSGTIVRTRSTSASNWRDYYNGGISNIPSTATWIIRKTGSDDPSLTSTGGMYYPNLTIENNSGTTWVTGSGSSFTGSSDYPRVKGNLDFGGGGSNTVSFLNDNTNATLVPVQGSITIRSGNTLRNNGTGFDLQGNLTVDGTVSYGSSNNRGLLFSGSGSQVISGSGTLNIYDITINKTSNNVTLNNSIVIDHLLTLTNKNIILGTYNLTLASSASISGGGSSSYIQTPSTGKLIKKFSTTGSFSYIVGDGTYYTPFSLTLNSGTLGSSAAIDVHTISSAETHVTSYSNYLNRYWEVNMTDVTNPNMDVSYIYADNDIHGSEASFVSTRWNAASSLKKIGTVNTATNTASAASVTSVGNFTAAGICTFDASINTSDPDNIIFQGETDTLTATSGASYLWSNSATTQSIIVTTAGTFTVTVTDNLNCTDTAYRTVTVFNYPTPQSLTYSQNFGTTTFTLMPTGMAAWKVASSPKGSQSSAESSTPIGDATITSATSAQTTSGCYGYATSSNGRLYIQTSSNTNNGTNQCAVAIITTGKQDIKVSYDIEMISAQARTIGVVLQYRVGTTGNWTTVSGGVYSHNNSDRSSGQVDSYTNLSLPSSANNNSVVQLRWATWRGSETGNSSGIGIDNIQISGSPITYCFRSKQSGNWNNTSTWEMSSDSSTWVNATITPSYHNRTLSILAGHTVTITASDTIDQIIINGNLTYGDNIGSTLTVYNGSGTDIIVNGTFEDIGPNSINWLSNPTWVIGSNGTLLRTRSTSSNNWRDHYENGISNIPSTANWIVRKTGTDSPTLSSTGSMYYPNLSIENNTVATWVTGTSSSFSGSADYPRIKGNLSIGGSGTGTVNFLNENTNSMPVLVEGNIVIGTGDTLRNEGTGFEIQGNFSVDGDIKYGATNSRELVFTGSASQSISGNGTINIYDLAVNKSANGVTLSKVITIDHLLTLTQRNIVLGANDIEIASTSTISGGSSSSYIQTNSSGRIVKKYSSTGVTFTFPTGDTSNYTPFTLSLNSGSLGSNPEIKVRIINSEEPHVTGYSDYINRYWVVQTNDIANGNADVSYVYSENDIQGSEGNFVAARWNSSENLQIIGTVNATTNTCTGIGITSAGNFTAAGICATTASISGSDPDNIICQGRTDTLTANTSASYLWNNNATTQSIIVTNQGNYVVTITDGFGCFATTSIYITVKQSPNAQTGENVNICTGNSITLTASGGSHYYWNNSDTTASIIVAPTSNTTYIVTVVDAFGCKDKDTVIVRVSSTFPTANAGPDLTVCYGSSATLSATGGGFYHWSSGSNAASTTLYPIATTVYKVTVTNGDGCKDTDDVTVTVNTLPKRYSLSSSGLNCSDGSAVLIILNGSEVGTNYQLLLNGSAIGSIQAGKGDKLYFNGQVSGIYTIRGTNATTGCSDLMVGSVVKN